MSVSFSVGIILVAWICYSIVVVIYLSSLRHKYLSSTFKVDTSSIKQLKHYKTVVEKYKDRDVINVLILSGGGVRGIIPLYILSYIERCTGKKAGEMFDFFAGSSTGAITVAGLSVLNSKGQYRFSAQDIYGYYKESSRQIFHKSWLHQIITCYGLFAPRFLPDGKRRILNYYFDNQTIGELGSNLIIPAYDLETNKLRIIRNWDLPNGAPNPNFLARELIDGASSPPMVFPPVSCSFLDKDYLFIDPAVLLNNPILPVMLYVRSLFPTKKINLVVLGNGISLMSRYNYRNMFSFGLYGLYQYLLSAPALSSHLYMEFITEYLADTKQLDPNTGLFVVNSYFDHNPNPLNVSDKNMQKMVVFAEKMLQENMNTVDKMITFLK